MAKDEMIRPCSIPKGVNYSELPEEVQLVVQRSLTATEQRPCGARILPQVPRVVAYGLASLERLDPGNQKIVGLLRLRFARTDQS